MVNVVSLKKQLVSLQTPVRHLITRGFIKSVTLFMSFEITPTACFEMFRIYATPASYSKNKIPVK